MKTKKKITIILEFGSEFQEEVMMKYFDAVRVGMILMEGGHKDNKFKFKIL